MKRTVLTVIAVVAIVSSSLAQEKEFLIRTSELTGVLEKTSDVHSPYKLLLDGTTNETFYLRGDMLSAYAQGSHVWVKGEVQIDLVGSINEKNENPRPPQWQIFFDVSECKGISKPFERPDVDRVTMDVTVTNLTEAMRIISDQTGYSVVITPEVEPMTHHIRLNDIPLDDAMWVILNLYDLEYRFVGDTIVIEKVKNGKACCCSPCCCKDTELKEE